MWQVLATHLSLSFLNKISSNIYWKDQLIYQAYSFFTTNTQILLEDALEGSRVVMTFLTTSELQRYYSALQ